jgi:predicted ATPase/class 3 adenylate cyclase
MLCQSCSADNPEGAKFCNGCAAPLPLLCNSCGSPNPPSAKFCNECATPLKTAPGPIAPAGSDVQAHATSSSASEGPPPDGERKTVTALFADIKGSTELIRDLDPEEARALLDPVLRLMIEAVHRYEGYVAQSTGDGIFALFGAPLAHEDHPQRALQAALAMQQAIREQASKHIAQGRPAIEARVGVSSGEVVVRTIETGGHTEYTPIGLTTNLAARLQTVAPPGSIAVSESVRQQCEGYFTFRKLGEVEVKGIGGPLTVHEVSGVGPLRTHFQLAARRGLTRFVGREHEIAAMQRALAQALKGHGQVVAVVAEAGTGKSRLFHEFKATLPPECEVLEAYSVSHGKASAWLPVLELLRGYFAIQDTDNPTSQREKVCAALATLDLALNDTLPYLSGLLGIQESPDPLAQMDPQIRRRRTLEAIKRIMLRESLEHALVVIFEDLHWIDSETQALLDLLADSVAGARLLLLVNYRPEYRHEWSSKGHYQQLRLDPLGGENAAAMLEALLGEGAELGPLKRLVAERTGGNPFFMEETVQALFDEGVLVRNGIVKVARSLSQLRLPPTVQGILASRIDRLAAEQKELLQTLAVIGRESSLGLIGRVASKAQAELERMLADLRAAEFIHEQPALTDAEYVFKHALTQEVAYNSLLIERRKLLHERTGQALESMFADQLDDHLGRLAHHYSRSDNVSKAVEYLGRAGQQAIQRSAHIDAISSLSSAIGLLQRLPDNRERIQRELRLQLALGPALIAIKGYAAPEVKRAFTRARELCERLGDPPELFPALLGMYYVHFLRAELRTAHGLAEQLVRRAQVAQDSALLLLAQSAMGQSSFQMGDLLTAREHLERAISLYDRDRHRTLAFRYAGVDAGVRCLSFGASTLSHLGCPDQALKRGNEAVALARALSHPHSLVFAEYFVGWVRLLRGEVHAAQEGAERVMALSTEHGFTLWLAIATTLRGAALVPQGRIEEGIAQMQEGEAAKAATGAKMGRTVGLTLLAEAYMRTGRFDDGRAALTEALVLADEHEDRLVEAETHRVKGELLLRQDHSEVADAQNCFERAIEIARSQSAKSRELRATMSLARLLASQGRRNEARTMLAEVYNWFTEGFDTADLKDAKALLDDLGG